MTQRCIQSFAFTVDGVPRVWAAGALVGDGDPILKTHKLYFEGVESQVKRQEAAPTSVGAVETASAAPDEPRHTTTTRHGAVREAGTK